MKKYKLSNLIKLTDENILNSQLNIFKSTYLPLFNPIINDVRNWYVHDSEDTNFIESEESVPSKEKQLYEYIFNEQNRNFIFIVGKAGCGKTTFLNYFLTTYEMKSEAQKLFYIRIDFNKLNFMSLHKYDFEDLIEELIHEKLMKAYPALEEEPAFYDIWDTVENWKSGYHKEIKKSLGEDYFKRERLKWIAEKRENLSLFNTAKFRYLVQTGYRLVIWFDNIDSLPSDILRHLLFFNEHKLKNINQRNKIKFVISCRDSTYSILRDFQTHTREDRSATIYIKPPNISDVLSIRYKYLFNSNYISNNIELKNYKLDEERYLHSIKHIINTFSNPIISVAIDSLSNSNTRLAFNMFKRAMSSSWFPWDQIFEFLKGNSEKLPVITWPRILAGIMTGRNNYYIENDSPIINIFGNNLKIESSSVLIRSQIVKLLDNNLYTKNGLYYVLDKIGYSNNQIETALFTLLKYGLIENDSKQELLLTKAGEFYLKNIILTFSYIQLTAFDTYLEEDLLSEFNKTNEINLKTGLNASVLLAKQIRREEINQEKYLIAHSDHELSELIKFKNNLKLSNIISEGIINDVKSILYSIPQSDLKLELEQYMEESLYNLTKS